MLVHHSHCLHKRISRRRPYLSPAAPLQGLAHRDRLNLSYSFPIAANNQFSGSDHTSKMLSRVCAIFGTLLAKSPLIFQSNLTLLMLREPPPIEKLANSKEHIFHSVVSQFVAQAGKTPQAIALVGQSETLTYQQLNQRINQLAHFLQQKGVGTGDLVAVQLMRSPHAIIAFLSVLKLGAAYVPIDPSYPVERRDYILQDSQSVALITNSSYIGSGLTYSGKRIQLDIDMDAIEKCSQTDLHIDIRPEDLAYVIYLKG